MPCKQRSPIRTFGQISCPLGFPDVIAPDRNIGVVIQKQIMRHKIRKHHDHILRNIYRYCFRIHLIILNGDLRWLLSVFKQNIRIPCVRDRDCIIRIEVVLDLISV